MSRWEREPRGTGTHPHSDWIKMHHGCRKATSANRRAVVEVVCPRDRKPSVASKWCVPPIGANDRRPKSCVPTPPRTERRGVSPGLDTDVRFLPICHVQAGSERGGRECVERGDDYRGLSIDLFNQAAVGSGWNPGMPDTSFWRPSWGVA